MIKNQYSNLFFAVEMNNDGYQFLLLPFDVGAILTYKQVGIILWQFICRLKWFSPHFPLLVLLSEQGKDNCSLYAVNDPINRRNVIIE